MAKNNKNEAESIEEDIEDVLQEGETQEEEPEQETEPTSESTEETEPETEAEEETEADAVEGVDGIVMAGKKGDPVKHGKHWLSITPEDCVILGFKGKVTAGEAIAEIRKRAGLPKRVRKTSQGSKVTPEQKAKILEMMEKGLL